MIGLGYRASGCVRAARCNAKSPAARGNYVRETTSARGNLPLGSIFLIEIHYCAGFFPEMPDTLAHHHPHSDNTKS